MDTSRTREATKVSPGDCPRQERGNRLPDVAMLGYEVQQNVVVTPAGFLKAKQNGQLLLFLSYRARQAVSGPSRRSLHTSGDGFEHRHQISPSPADDPTHKDWVKRSAGTWQRAEIGNQLAYCTTPALQHALRSVAADAAQRLHGERPRPASNCTAIGTWQG
ncbi:hypothetical protein ACCO45_013982 [Purpureocillium lilacinum]|uniref:Uncharacterized protein n=1 Tax=Purpureocillium lilacinum TaxID=33203 RepID=A0ACC4DAD7_PURLI